MSTHENPDQIFETIGGPPCPRCDAPLTLLVEPGVAEFFCPNGHSVAVPALLKKQADEARHTLAETLRHWEERRTEMERLTREARASGAPGVLALCERRLQLIGGRLATLRQALQQA